MFDGCHLQWCPVSSQLVLYLLQYKKKIISNSHISNDEDNSTESLDSPKTVEPKKSYSVEVNFRGLNLFALNDYNTGIAFRADLLKLTSCKEKAKVLIEGFKLSFLNAPIKVSFLYILYTL